MVENSRKKMIILFLISAISICTIACGSKETQEAESSVYTDEIKESIKLTTEEEASDKINSVDRFIELYNEISDIAITDLIDIDIHDKSGGYYRTEFRTYAYNDAIAKHGIAGENISMDMIQYSRGFRIYVLAKSYEELQRFLETAVKIYDPSITDDMIQSNIYDTIDFVGSGVSFYINDITGYYEILNRETGSCSLMLDTSSLEFCE